MSHDAQAALLTKVASLDTQTAIERLDARDPTEVAKLLASLPQARANAILAAMSEEARARIMEAAPVGTDWSYGQRYP